MSEKKTTEEESFRPLRITALIVVGIWAIAGALLLDSTNDTFLGDRGTFGDMFGAVNALFSGLAFAGIIFTIFLQRRELQLQRDELIRTGDEIAGQRKQLEAQSKTFSKQSFESTFFSLLQRLGAVSSSPMEGVILSFQVIRDCSIRDMKSHGIAPDDLIEAVRKVVSVHIREHQDILDVFHQVLLTVLRYVDDSDQENKRFYTDVVRCSLNHSQLFCVFYATALNDDPRHSELRALVEKYGLFKYLSPAHLLSPDHMRAFASTAFG